MRWLRRLFQRRKDEEELEKELRFHLDQHTSDLITQGKSPEEARRQARIALGGPEQVKEMCRDERGTRWTEDLLQDLRYGVRILAKHPSFTAVAVLALALGIGVNTAILSAVNGLVLRPLPVENPAELVAPYWGRKTDTQVWGEFSYPNYLDLRDQNKSFSDLSAWAEISAGVSSSESRDAGDSGQAEAVWGELPYWLATSRRAGRPALIRCWPCAMNEPARTRRARARCYGLAKLGVLVQEYPEAIPIVKRRRQ